MDSAINILVDIMAMLVTLGILVTIHEYGHFWVARRCGVKIECFSIGFGKALFSWKRGETEYRIAALPLGGYVKMYGEQQAAQSEVVINDKDKDRAFNHKSLLQRSLIVAAGPVANFALAVLLYWLMFLTGVSGVAPVVGTVDAGSPAAFANISSGDEVIEVDGEPTRTWQEVRLKLLERLGESGNLRLKVLSSNTQVFDSSINIERWLSGESEPDVLGSIGIKPYRLDIPAKIGELTVGGRAESAGIQTDDLILAVNDESLQGWIHWVEIIRANPEQELIISLERDRELQSLVLKPALHLDDSGEPIGQIGAGVQQPEVWPTLPVSMNREISYSVLGAIPQAFEETWSNIVFVLDSMKKMVIGLISVKNLSGPLTIAQVAGDTVSYGLEYYISFLAVLSISLGVLNLLPVPVLDGGHLFFYLIEAIIRRPVPEQIQAMGMQFGVLLIAGIMLIAFYNDVNRFFL